MDFVEVYENAVPASECAALIARFEKSEPVRGKTGSGVNTRLKDSWDIPINTRAEWADAVKLLNSAMLPCLMAYVRKYPFAALAPFLTEVTDPASGERTPIEADRVPIMPEPDLARIVAHLFRPGTINIQKYLADEGGYPHWHSEVYPTPGNDEALHRTLLWTIYLNDAFAKGETEFFHQGRKIVPKTGSLLLAPTAFTHTHRGNRPEGGAKYIATSWVLMQRAETLYRGPAKPAPSAT